MKHNNVQLIGYVADSPIIRILPSGDKKATMRVATHHEYKGKNNDTTRVTTWHDVVAWKGNAEFAERSFVRGSHILVNGSIIYSTYPDLTGHIRYITEIIADALINLDR
ncbi:MAG: single-stranded DNA-binding protein [Bacteroidetes bacterium]|nr:single-stranded DNA-binding protein [Bacteroidota bacterium]